MLTVPPHHHRCGGAENRHVGHHVPYSTGIVSRIQGLHLGYVQVACLLRDKAPRVLLQEVALSIETP